MKDELARFFHQRVERGEGPLLLESFTRREMMAAARSVPVEAAGGPGATSSREDAPVRSAGPPAGESSGSPSAPFARDGAVTDTSVRPDSSARPEASTSTTTPAGGGALPTLPAELPAVREIALGCTLCRLSETRNHVVFADGVPSPRVLVLGEAPGQNEDATGLPFVGAAGKLLDLLLASVGVSRQENAYICNVLKCRPPGNRNPLPDEIASCTPYLRRQVQLVAPEVILAVGTFAAQWVTGREIPLGKLRGSVYSYEGIPVIVTYHPAALLRNSGWTRATWDDLQLLRSILDGS